MMNYLQALKTIKEIESNYDILAIKFKSIPIWPYLRIYLFDSLLESHRAQGYTGSNIKRVLKSVFYYNPIPLFKHLRFGLLGTLQTESLLMVNISNLLLAQYRKFATII